LIALTGPQIRRVKCLLPEVSKTLKKPEVERSIIQYNTTQFNVTQRNATPLDATPHNATPGKATPQHKTILLSSFLSETRQFYLATSLMPKLILRFRKLHALRLVSI